MVHLKTKREGRDAIFKDYEQLAVDFLYEEGNPIGSGAVFKHVLSELKKRGKTISRASIIFFLQRLEDQKLLEVTDATGKGGHHSLYFANLPPKDFQSSIMRTILKSALEALPLVERKPFEEFFDAKI